jgi:hypothetical protein
VFEGNAAHPSQALLGPSAPALRIAIAREWIQPRWRLELASEFGTVQVQFDETGRAALAAPLK